MEISFRRRAVVDVDVADDVLDAGPEAGCVEEAEVGVGGDAKAGGNGDAGAVQFAEVGAFAADEGDVFLA